MIIVAVVLVVAVVEVVEVVLEVVVVIVVVVVEVQGGRLIQITLYTCPILAAATGSGFSSSNTSSNL